MNSYTSLFIFKAKMIWNTVGRSAFNFFFIFLKKYNDVECKNIAMRDYQESVTTKKVYLLDRRTDRQTDRQTPDKVIPMCCYASQATQ